MIDFLLKDPAAMCGFIFGKRILCFLLSPIILLYAHNASAFFSDGKIDDDFSYRSLRIEMLKTKRANCVLEGEILNNTGVTQEDIAITFYAYDFFGHSLWKQIVRIDLVDSYNKGGKGRPFRIKMRHCEMPAKFQFKVSGVRKEDVGKATADKPKSKKSVSRNTRQKDDSGAGDFHTGQAKSPKDSPARDSAISKDGVPGAETTVVPIRKYLIILTNGKEIATDSYREQDNMVFFYKDGGEVQISKEKVSEIRKLD